MDLPGGSTADDVNLSLTAPVSLAIGQTHELRFWAHIEAQTATVMSRALSALGVLDPRRLLFKTEGPFRVSRGTVLSHSSVGSKLGTASVRSAGTEIARISFVLSVGASSGRTGRVHTSLKRHKKAFASYASEDREAVMARIQGIQKAAPALRVFVDVMNLRSGDDWERKLNEAITQSDVFYLFWCRHAKKSEWVEKEWRYAYQSRGIDFIDPVPLESPVLAPPPPELSKKHFNEPILSQFSQSDHTAA